MKDFFDNILWNIHKFWTRICRIFHWIPIIWNDYDWDASYLLEIEQQKLKTMCKWFKDEDYGSTVDGKRIYNQMMFAISLLDIILEKDNWWEIDNSEFEACSGSITDKLGKLKYKLHKYVNINNYKLYIPYVSQKSMTERTDLWRIELRQEKAWYLYCKLRQHYLKRWWD